MAQSKEKKGWQLVATQKKKSCPQKKKKSGESKQMTKTKKKHGWATIKTDKKGKSQF